MPFLVAVAIAGVVIWRMMVWRYGGIIAKQEDEVSYLTRQLTRQPVHKLDSAGDPSAPVTVTSSPLPDPSIREFVGPEVTPISIGMLRMRGDDLQAHRTAQSYVGKWMVVTGAVVQLGIAHGEEYLTVDCYDGDSLRERLWSRPTFWFDNHEPRLERLRIGDTVCAQGQIENTETLGTILIHSELVD